LIAIFDSLLVRVLRAIFSSFRRVSLFAFMNTRYHETVKTQGIFFDSVKLFLLTKVQTGV
jgi:hypothetical protein